MNNCNHCGTRLKQGGCFAEIYWSCPKCDWGDSARGSVSNPAGVVVRDQQGKKRVRRYVVTFCR